jgi:hypothetical protein
MELWKGIPKVQPDDGVDKRVVVWPELSLLRGSDVWFTKSRMMVELIRDLRST